MYEKFSLFLKIWKTKSRQTVNEIERKEARLTIIKAKIHTRGDMPIV